MKFSPSTASNTRIDHFVLCSKSHITPSFIQLKKVTQSCFSELHDFFIFLLLFYSVVFFGYIYRLKWNHGYVFWNCFLGNATQSSPNTVIVLHFLTYLLSHLIPSIPIRIHLSSFQGYLCSRLGRYAIFLSELLSVSSAHHPPFLCLSENLSRQTKYAFRSTLKTYFPHRFLS